MSIKNMNIKAGKQINTYVLSDSLVPQLLWDCVLCQEEMQLDSTGESLQSCIFYVYIN